MSQAKSSLHADQSPKDNVRICAHTIEKKESRKLSRFQALGHLCGWADGLVGDDSNAGNTIGVILGFGVEIDALGFDYYDPVHLLSAPNWKIRMYAAWCIIGSEEQPSRQIWITTNSTIIGPVLSFAILTGTTKSSTRYQSSRLTTNHLSSEWLLLWGGLLGRNL